TPEYELDRKRLASGEPLGYVIGSQPFLGLKIYLDSKPLIPRPETEWWTEQLLQSVRNTRERLTEERTERDGARLLDLCAGSGAIGCAALKILPYMEVFFSEIDSSHEMTILKNIRENGLDESRAFVRIGDLFEPFGNMTFDIIAANPPYVPAKRELPESVAKHEPAGALFAGDEGLDVIRRIAAELPRRLSRGGVAWIECDSAHAAAACALFKAAGLSAEIRTDQYGAPRLIVVSFS
ncbi:MAG: HemK family protein methyltransferase, partial [Patescibacteria group bacterium]|nr:HemK family protein methyltransferase [Patescibacteria group bacterium]